MKSENTPKLSIVSNTGELVPVKAKPKRKFSPHKKMQCPSYIRGDARALFNKIAKRAVWLDPVFDQHILAVTAITLARYLANPTATKPAMLNQLRHLLRDCGLSPSTRKRLSKGAA